MFDADIDFEEYLEEKGIDESKLDGERLKMAKRLLEVSYRSCIEEYKEDMIKESYDYAIQGSEYDKE